ncbi:hypothetical protein TNIN_61901 [Trichonephila inaurata madagascariensis]|uniref:Uncharacterized protein n=1 Tax=Trichonephila inaurata madagascariensis TaxID=2747483 RepID=A0A8X7C318_9ARAC|nr:hypothetical protein TNIN_61901 [Trichonephila inaurata madagascariensis]
MFCMSCDMAVLTQHIVKADLEQHRCYIPHHSFNAYRPDVFGSSIGPLNCKVVLKPLSDEMRRLCDLGCIRVFEKGDELSRTKESSEDLTVSQNICFPFLDRKNSGFL